MGIAFAFQQPVRFKGLMVSDLLGLAAGKELTNSQLCSYLQQVGLCAQEYIGREVNASLSGGEIKMCIRDRALTAALVLSGCGGGGTTTEEKPAENTGSTTEQKMCIRDRRYSLPYLKIRDNL